MTLENELLEDTAEDLFENAPCGYLSTLLDGTIVKLNRTFEEWTGLDRADVVGNVRFQDLLSPGGRIYHETHYAPLLRMQGSVREIAVELVRADGTRLPALVNSVLRAGADGSPRLIRTTIFDATDRRRYEQELLAARRREQGIAQELQRSLLSGDLPVDPRVQIAVAYHPGVAGLDVGGDWYDGFWLDDSDAIGLVVGDVVGKGIEAAATMGQLRSAVRALAATGAPPGTVLETVDRFSMRHGIGKLATLVYARLDLATRSLRFACAGHPPPILLEEGADPRFAWGGRSLPVGVQVGPRTDVESPLMPGAAVLLYTDGLIERRSSSLDDGMDAFLAGARRRRAEPAEAFVRSVVRDLTEGEQQSDDVCLLLARLSA